MNSHINYEPETVTKLIKCNRKIYRHMCVHIQAQNHQMPTMPRLLSFNCEWENFIFVHTSNKLCTNVCGGQYWKFSVYARKITLNFIQLFVLPTESDPP